MSLSLHNHRMPSVLLIVENEFILDSLAELLELEDFLIYTAKNCAEAINKIANGAHPNILIVDVRLPNKSGVDAIQRVRTFIGEEIPSIILTGESFREMQKATNLKNCNILYIPQESHEIVSRIHSLAA